VSSFTLKFVVIATDQNDMSHSCKKIVFAICLIFTAISCAKKDTATSTSSTDYDGTYLKQGVTCSNSVGAIAAAQALGGTYVDTLSIVNGGFSEVKSSTGCTAAITGTFAAAGSTLSFTAIEVTSATAGNCTVAQTIAAGTITPTTINTNYVLAATVTSLTGIASSWGIWTGTIKTLLIEDAAYTAGAGTICYDQYVLQ
jgi:hypothetical protein